MTLAYGSDFSEGENMADAAGAHGKTTAYPHKSIAAVPERATIHRNVFISDDALF
jgi:hypothetical protein